MMKKPQTVVIPLQTLTPLYTGGIGQFGEQLQPSGLLGSVRHFSCLVANTLGDSDFEKAVWGAALDGDAHGKTVALRWDMAELKMVTLPNSVRIPKEDGKTSTWYFNEAQDGKFALHLTRTKISEVHWQILLLAVRIQTNWATFGAKDQFGLGVLRSDTLPSVNKNLISTTAKPLDKKVGLHRGFFAKLQFKHSGGSYEEKLKLGLIWRSYLRNQFRRSASETKLRHYLFGKLGEFGSAINVSAAYQIDNEYKEIRIWGVIPHTQPAEFLDKYDEIIKRLQAAIDSRPDDFSHNITQRYFETYKNNVEIASWLNQLAGQ
jgi:hypothetical protein